MKDLIECYEMAHKALSRRIGELTRLLRDSQIGNYDRGQIDMRLKLLMTERQELRTAITEMQRRY